MILSKIYMYLFFFFLNLYTKSWSNLVRLPNPFWFQCGVLAWRLLFFKFLGYNEWMKPHLSMCDSSNIHLLSINKIITLFLQTIKPLYFNKPYSKVSYFDLCVLDGYLVLAKSLFKFEYLNLIYVNLRIDQITV